jgi:hypothetical protein
LSEIWFTPNSELSTEHNTMFLRYRQLSNGSAAPNRTLAAGHRIGLEFAA